MVVCIITIIVAYSILWRVHVCVEMMDVNILLLGCGNDEVILLIRSQGCVMMVFFSWVQKLTGSVMLTQSGRFVLVMNIWRCYRMFIFAIHE